ncbi:MAG: phenylalanine--tRNA ligase subunit alpha, partial [Desulfobulbaceae bacterium]|nr:phenylalanine--tRNA ligase subunit alpha [Desulfobulbaceae bacterium]
MEDEILRLKAEATSTLAELGKDDLEPFRVKYLGRKGLFTSLMRQLGKAPAEDRPRLGKLANDIKQELAQAFAARQDELGAGNGGGSKDAPRLDLSLQGRTEPAGRPHPVTQVMEEVCGIFEGLGFTVAEGPDVETDFYNFEAL